MDMPGKSVKYCPLVKGSFKPVDHFYKLVVMLFEKAIFSFFLMKMFINHVCEYNQFDRF